jgi:Tfp pilus tip-associated adhesin PilY1
MALWEFADADLGLSWSKVNTGRVRVKPAGQSVAVARFVAVFGGGLDPADPSLGQHLYMVDVETGTALWKRPVIGAVPSEPAAVDTDRDGFLDTIYVGTVAGSLYKVDVRAPGDLDPATGRVDDARQWAPFRLFDTGGREIFFRPTVVFDAGTGRHAIGFGTGNRSDLWSRSRPGQSGRFYMIVDLGYTAGAAELASGPLTESSFQRIAADSSASGGNLLAAPTSGNRPGWVLELGDDERVVTDALAVSGFLSFTTFDPERPDLCSFAGTGHVYALLASNADAAAGGAAERAIEIDGVAGRPIVTNAGFSQRGGRESDPFSTPRIHDVRASLADLFPADCRFGAFSLSVSTTASSGEVVPLAQIPVCVARKNWTEVLSGAP